MEIKREYLQKYLHDIAVDQLVADYQSKGYHVSVRDQIGNYHPDLVARKGDEVVIVEVKADKLTPEKRQQVAGIGDFVRSHRNYKFLVVLATPPEPKAIDIPNLDQLLHNYLIDNFPDGLRKLFANTQIKSVTVTDVTPNEVTLTETENIAVKGNAVIEVELRYANDFFDVSTDNSTAHVKVFPCSFDITLSYTPDKQLIVSAAKELTIDTSDSFEE